jgi:S1-C subfamily serine protease
MRKLVSIVSFLVLLSSFPLSAGQLTPEEKRALTLKPAVVLVVVQFRSRLTLDIFPKPIEVPHTSIGTGFLFRPDGYLATNGHVVASANLKDAQASDALRAELRKEFADAMREGKIFRFIETEFGRPLSAQEKIQVASSRFDIKMSHPTVTVVLANGTALNADILQFSAAVDQHGKDVAILKVPGNNLPTVALGNSDNVRLQDQIMVMGYPGLASSWGGGSVSSLISAESSLEPTATNGHISALKIENIGTPVLQSDVAITHGNSGGPAFNDRGEVIGLATYGVQEVQGFNFLVPINTAMEYIRQTGVAAESGAFNKHWSSALDLYDDGQCNHAITEFNNVAQFMPNLPDAQRYRAAAVACVDKMSWAQKLLETTGKGPAYGLFAVVVLGGGALLLLRRPGRASVKPAPAVVAVAAASAKGGPSAPQATASPGSGAERSAGRIQFIAGPLSGRTFKIEKEGLWIGRDPSQCAVVLPDDTISSQHCWVVPAGGEVVVIDKGSSNGTYLNSVDSPRISKIGVHNGDRICLGKKGAVVFTYFAG